MQDLPCNTFTWCGEPAGCFEPDVHAHTFRDCWLKFTEAPAVPEVPPRFHHDCCSVRPPLYPSLV